MHNDLPKYLFVLLHAFPKTPSPALSVADKKPVHTPLTLKPILGTRYVVCLSW